MGYKPPKGWLIVYSGDSQDKAVESAARQRAKGRDAKVIKHMERTLAMRSYVNYTTIAKVTNEELEHDFQQGLRER